VSGEPGNSRRSTDYCKEAGMGIGLSIFLIAVGAIITFAVNVVVSGLNLNAVGVILMVVGGIGLVWSLVVATSARGWRSSSTTVIEDRPVVRRTEVHDLY
jgi:hypothetical protein